MHQDRLGMGASPHLSDLWSHAVLRLVSQPACEQTRPRQQPSGHRIRGAEGTMAVLLSR